jgi:DNA-binding response OmpR family regulator
MKSGHEIFEARNAEDGRKVYLEKKLDLVITDILMPGRDGIEAILDLQTLSPRPKILAISGRDKKLLTLVEDLGADMTFEKPLRAEDLEPAIRDILKNSERKICEMVP